MGESADDGDGAPTGRAPRVALLGAAGATGRSALTALRAHGSEVVAHSRRAGPGVRLPFSSDPAVTWVDGDIIGDSVRLHDVLDGAQAVVDLRVALPVSVRTAGAFLQYARVRDTGFGRVVAACRDLGIRRIIHDTVTMVYRDGGARWLDESSPVSAAGPMRANLAGEDHLRRFSEDGGAGVTLRLGMVHGDDPLTRAIVAAARRGWFAVPGSGDGYLSTIALPDVGTAVVAALRAPAGVYNVAEEPRTRAEWRRAYAREAGSEDLHALPGFLGGPLGRSQRVSSAKFAAATGWCPAAREPDPGPGRPS